MTDSEADDDALASRLRLGDATAARELYERHGGALLRFGLAMTGCRQTAEDMVHDTFIEVLQGPRRFDPARGSAASYLYGVARHRLSRLTRSGLYRVEDSLHQTVDADDVLDDAIPRDLRALRAETSAEDEIDRDQLIECVRQAVLGLPFAQREVVALCDLEELPYATVASILGCPIGTVRSRLHRARGMLAGGLAALGVLQGMQTDSTSASARDANPPDASLSMELPCKGATT
jgi:RNA polymerase sigma-70 factor (ECF subfamily)